jgi:hypothetical protein
MYCFQSSKDPPDELGHEGFPAATLATDIAALLQDLLYKSSVPCTPWVVFGQADM